MATGFHLPLGLLLLQLCLGVHSQSLRVTKACVPKPNGTLGPHTTHWAEGRALDEENMVIWDDMRFPQDFTLESGIIGDQYRWPLGVIPYKITGFTDEQVKLIKKGLKRIAVQTRGTTFPNLPCITFRHKLPTDTDYVNIVTNSYEEDSKGCFSAVGRQTGAQTLNLGRKSDGGDCVYIETIMHEMIHAIGFYHEQSRPDRDDYISINCSNITPENYYNFDKYDSNEVNTYNISYDLNSVMQYYNYAFAIDSSYNAMSKINDPNFKLGREFNDDTISASDIRKIRAMYKCM